MSSKKLAVVGSSAFGHLNVFGTPIAGVVQTGSPNVFAHLKAVARYGDEVSVNNHCEAQYLGQCTQWNTHTFHINASATKEYANGKAVARVGDGCQEDPNHKITDPGDNTAVYGG